MSEARFDEPEYEEPTAEPEPAETEAAAEPEPVVEEEVKPVPTVPLAALNEERHRSREQRAAHAAEIAALKETVNEWRKSQQKASEEVQKAQETTQFQKDPLGALHEEIRSLKAAQETATNETRQQAAQREQLENFQRTVVAQVSEFTKVTPDYQDALAHLVEVRKAELRVMGVAEAQLDIAVDQESMGLAQTALQRGMNPGQLVYELAKARGFTGKKPAATPKPKLDVIEEGQKINQSLSDGGRDSSLNLADVSKMSDKEFDDFWEKEMRGSAKGTSRH